MSKDWNVSVVAYISLQVNNIEQEFPLLLCTDRRAWDASETF